MVAAANRQMSEPRPVRRPDDAYTVGTQCHCDNRPIRTERHPLGTEDRGVGPLTERPAIDGPSHLATVNLRRTN